MAYNYGSNPSRMVIEESPWATLIQSLPETLLNLYSLNQQLAFKSEEAEKSRKWEESMIYLSDQIEDKNIAVARFHENKKTARELGVLPPSVTTKGGLDFADMGAAAIERENAAIDKNIDLYYQGLNVGNKLDENASGFLEDKEVGAYLEELYPEGDAPEALQQGLQAWTLDPVRRAALETARLGQELTQQELLERRKKFEFLPQHEKNALALEEQQLVKGDVDIDLGELAIKKGDFELDLLGISVDEAYLKLDQMRQGLEQGELNLSIGQLQLEQGIEQLDSFVFDEEVKIRDYVIKTAGEALVGNIEAQTAIGASILSNVTLRNNDGSYTPLFTLLTDENINADEVISQINKSNYSKNIRQDMLSLVEAYHVGKGEDQLPDYSFVLDEVGRIEQLDVWYRGWYEKNSTELEQYVIAEGYESLDDFKQKLGQQNTNAIYRLRKFANAIESPYDVKRILKAIEWRGTGILDEDISHMREDARIAKKQHKHLSALLEQAQAKSLSVGMMYAEPTYTKVDTSSILAPFDTMPLRSGRDIDDIFNINLKDRDKY